MNKDNSAPAFPSDSNEFGSVLGMSLRDYFAAKALAAMISNTARSVDLGVSYPQNNAHFSLASYAVADAMLAARSA